VKYFVDTGPLAAFLNEREKDVRLRQWSVEVLSSIDWPLYSCEAVLTETAHFIRTAQPLVEMVEAGEIVLPFSLSEQAGDIRRIIESYHNRDVSLADSFLVRLTELWRDSVVITSDVNDFSIYRRFGRDYVPYIGPP
jgi:predicted nucleic acid-binding protein